MDEWVQTMDKENTADFLTSIEGEIQQKETVIASLENAISIAKENNETNTTDYRRNKSDLNSLRKELNKRNGPRRNL